MTQAYPLQWPIGRKRSPMPVPGVFKNCNHDRCIRELVAELERLGAENVVVSTNQPIRADGMPYAAKRIISDPGVAVYFTRNDKPLSFACDQYDTIPKNMRGITKTIEAMRGIERWGSKQMMEQAFTGFEALPHLATEHWTEVFNLPGDAPCALVEKQYKVMRSETHPDKPSGNATQFDRVQKAWDQYQKESE